MGQWSRLPMFHSPQGAAKAAPRVVQLFLLMCDFGLGNVYWTFNLLAKNSPFETLKYWFEVGGGGRGRNIVKLH